MHSVDEEEHREMVRRASLEGESGFLRPTGSSSTKAKGGRLTRSS